MSAARLEEYISDNLVDKQSEIRQERARILEMASQKAKEKTLTLKETADLYEKFNKTFDANFKPAKQAQLDDESWALKLIEESEEELNNSLETRINGEVLSDNNKSSLSKELKPQTQIMRQKIYQEELKPAPPINEPAKIREKSKFIDFFTYDQFSLFQDAEDLDSVSKKTKPVLRLVSLCVLILTLVTLDTFWFQ